MQRASAQRKTFFQACSSFEATATRQRGPGHPNFGRVLTPLRQPGAVLQLHTEDLHRATERYSRPGALQGTIPRPPARNPSRAAQSLGCRSQISSRAHRWQFVLLLRQIKLRPPPQLSQCDGCRNVLNERNGQLTARAASRRFAEYLLSDSNRRAKYDEPHRRKLRRVQRQLPVVERKRDGEPESDRRRVRIMEPQFNEPFRASTDLTGALRGDRGYELRHDPRPGRERDGRRCERADRSELLLHGDRPPGRPRQRSRRTANRIEPRQHRKPTRIHRLRYYCGIQPRK